MMTIYPGCCWRFSVAVEQCQSPAALVPLGKISISISDQNWPPHLNICILIHCIHDHALIPGRKTDPSRSNCRLKQHRGDNGKWYHKQAGKSYFWWPFWERKYLVLLSIRFLAQMFLAFYKIRFLIFFFQVPGAGSEPAKHCSPDMSGSWKWKRVLSPSPPLSAGFIIQHVLEFFWLDILCKFCLWS